MGDMTISVDDSTLLAAMRSLGPRAESFTKSAANVTADHIVDEARRRAARATGETASGIVAQESRDGTGYDA